jgi:hypothetical protein
MCTEYLPLKYDPQQYSIDLSLECELTTLKHDNLVPTTDRPARPLPGFYTAISLKVPGTSLERNFIRRWSVIQYCTHTSHTNIQYVRDAFKLRDQITYPERNMTQCSLVETYQSFAVIC